LTPIHLWALAVGLVISGEYFGWSYGFGVAGPIGLAIAVIPVTIFYVTFILSYSELATAIPHAGGPSAYSRRAMGPFWGYLNGISCLVEFVFAPPAVALAIGGAIHYWIPGIPMMGAAIGSFVFFIFLNYLGMRTSSMVELIVTVLASIGLVLFYVAAAPHFHLSMVITHPLLPFGWSGVMAAVPFAIWFYLAIEGGAMAAEECVDPQKDIPEGFLSGMGTLVVMALLVLFLTAGIANWKLVTAVDYPLPVALAAVYGARSFIVLAVNFIALAGLIASLHGIMVGYSRQTYVMARSGYLPKFLAYLDPRFRSPVWALVVPGIIGIGAVLTGLTSMVITISAFGAVALYLLSLIALFVLRAKEPDMKRPFKVWYPVIPIISFITGLFCLYGVTVSSVPALKWVVVIYVLAIAYYYIWGNKNILPYKEEFAALDELDA
jgi:ethanolamine permease